MQGIISSDGQLWQEQRRFALKHLKDFGFGKAGLEGVIQEEAEEIVKHLGQFDRQDFRMNTVFGVPVINILWTIVAGRRFQLDDPRVERMMTLLNRFVSLRREEREESEDQGLFQIVQGPLHPGVSVPSVRPPVLLHPWPGHQEEDHHRAERDVPAVHH